MINFKNVQISYGDFVAVDDLNLEIKEGEFFTFLGPSGCGKSTTLRTLVGFIDPSKGSIFVDDKDITRLAPEKREIGIVFQSYALFPTMTVYDNIAYGLKIKKMPKSEIDAKVNEIAQKIKISDKQLQRNVSELSGGQQQRVALARALVLEPKILCLDEPLSNLDAKLRIDLRLELKRLQRDLGITTLYVTHDQEEALAMSDWIFVMNDGEIVQSGTPVDIYDEPINHFVATFIGESNILPGKMIEDYLVEFNGKRFEAVDGGMRPNEQVEVVIRPEDLRITLPEEGKLQVKVDTQLFRGVHYEIIAYDELGNEWMIHSTRKAIVGEEIGLDFEPEDIHIMRLNETEEEFDARIEEYVEMEEQEAGLINAIEEERDEENNL